MNLFSIHHPKFRESIAGATKTKNNNKTQLYIAQISVESQVVQNPNLETSLSKTFSPPIL